MRDNTNTVVVYHKSCADGQAAAAVAFKALGLAPKYVAMSYSDDQYDKLKHLLGTHREIYFLDFSPSEDFLNDYRVEGLSTKDITVIDHHKNVDQEMLYSRTNYIFNNDKSGCVLAHEYFFPGKEIPHLLEILQDRDIWKWTLPQTKPFTAGYDASTASFTELIEKMEEKPGSEWYQQQISKGAIALLDLRKRAASIAGKAGIKKLDTGETFALVNTAQDISEVGNYLCQNMDIDFSMSFFVTGEGKVIFSLRSIAPFNVGKIARRFGGGGHDQAAGFTGDLRQVEEFFNS